MSQISSHDSIPTQDDPSEDGSPAQARLAALAEVVEAEEAGLRVVAARLASLPYVDVEATVEIREARQFNILEAFILRAAHELQPVPTLDSLAGMLGLDPLFVHASWARLSEMGAVTLSGDGTPRLTTQGRDSYLQGQLPPSSSEEALSLRYWTVSDQLVVLDRDAAEGIASPRDASAAVSSEDAPSGVLPDAPSGVPSDAPSGVPPDAVSIGFPGYVAQSEVEREAAAVRALQDLKRLVAATDEAGLGLHQPDEGQTIHAVPSWAIARTGVMGCAVLVVQETLATGVDADTVMLRAMALATGQRLFDVEAVLKRWMTAGRVTLRDLLKGQPTEVGS